MPSLSDEDGFLVDARFLAIVEKTVRRVLETDGRKPAGRMHGHKFTQNCFLAKNGATPIAGRSGGTPGSGPVALWRCDDSGQLFLVNADLVTAYNLATAEVAANAYLMLVRIGNCYWIMFEDCGP